MPTTDREAELPRLLTVGEVASLLRVKKRTVYDWVQTGRIPFRKAGRITLFDRDEVIEWTKGGAPKGAVTALPFPR